MTSERKKSGSRREARPRGLLARSVLLAAALAVGRAAPAESLPPDLDPKTVARLIQRLDAQDEKIKNQDAKIQSQDAELKDLRTKISTGTAPAVEALPALPPPSFPNLQFHGFGDVDYHASDRPGEKNAFMLGEFDIFLTSQLAENLSVLSETVFAAGSDNNFGLDIERLILQYKPKDWLNLEAGRFHTAIGYYNTAYHHGTWFQNAVGRPWFLNYEDSGGLVPVHTVGVSIHGELPVLPKMGLQYFVEIGNGRNYSTGTGNNPVQNVVDDNGFKAFNLAFTSRPECLPGLQFGAGAYHDTVTGRGFPRIDEWLFHEHVVYKNSVWEFLSEGYLFRHQAAGGPARFSTAAFAQVARKFGLLTPYVRFSYVNLSMTDLIYNTLLGNAGAHYGPGVGLRYDFASFAALKVQFDRSFDTGTRGVNEVTVQAAFTF